MSPVLQFPTSNAPSDTDAREQALNTRISCIVEAPAGSGKTGLLMQRYLKLLAEDSVTQPEEILAITFTNKATAELRERIIHQLQSAHTSITNTLPSRPEPASTPNLSSRPESAFFADAVERPAVPTASAFEHETHTLAAAVIARDTQLNWNILARPQRLNIRTIDSICAEIANSLPLLSGSGGSQRPTTDAMPLYRLAAQRTLMQLGGADRDLHHALYTVLLHRDGSLTDVESLLASMLSQREQWGEIIPLNPTELEATNLDSKVRLKLERALEAIVCNALTRATNLMPPGMLHRLTSLAAQLGLNAGYKDNENPIAFCTTRKDPPAEAADHLDHWQALISLLLTNDGAWRKSLTANHIKFEMSKAERATLQQLIEEHKSDDLCEALCAIRELPPASYPDEQWAVTKSLFHVLRRALAELKVLFAERNTCDFTEIAIAARGALSSTDESAVDLALTPGGQLRHLLVDEMQDTSAAQYELIHLLTRSWDGATQTLFLVGDPKQSIYLFRQARVERFLRTMRDKHLGDIPLTPLYLTANFRSQAALVHDFNDTFEKLFPTLEETQRTHNTTDVPFVAATPTREETETENIMWHATDLSAASDTPHPIEEARDIRGIIEHWLSQTLPEGRTKPWRIAILARNRSHLTPVVAELKRSNIAYRAVDIDPLATRPEVLDAFALTRAILHPADRAAWLAVLHAPWCGLSLADLLALTGEGPGTDPCATIASLVAQALSSRPESASSTYASILSSRPERSAVERPAVPAPTLSLEGQQLLTRTWPTLEASIATLGTDNIATHIERTWRSLGGDAPLTSEQRTNVQRYLNVLRELAAESTFVDLTLLKSRLQTLYAEPASGNIAVELLTIHKAKGLEWDVVLIPGLERKSGSNTAELLSWLELDTTDTEASPIILAPIWSKGADSDKLNKWLNRAKEARENAERKRLFYVLATRAREELHLFAAANRKQDGTFATPIHGSLLKAVWPAAEQAFNDLSTPSALASQFEQSLAEESLYDDQPLALAAAAAPFPPPTIHRLPADFNPLQRFIEAAAHKLPYTPASALRQAPTFDRPEGSFAVRAFGNVVHRYLQVLTEHLLTKPSADLLAELPTWQPRLLASLRGEGLSPTLAEREATRALAALTQSLTDPIGQWILSPQTSAFTERPLTSSAPLAPTLRVDRTFLASATPGATGDTHTWIVDFKTATQRGLSNAAFEAEERAKYTAQLETYATTACALDPDPKPIILALYYPLLPRLIYWPS
jgi:ATP-dependent helicase/nuclease subunit A